MMKKIVAAIIMTLALAGVGAMPALAVQSGICSENVAQELKDAAGCTDNLTTVDQTANSLINVVLSVLGIVAVIVVILGGIQFMTSAGDPGKAAKGKNTILFGLIGLIVALLAYAIVNFVLKEVFG